jgi:hypothetical protein
LFEIEPDIEALNKKKKKYITLKLGDDFLFEIIENEKRYCRVELKENEVNKNYLKLKKKTETKVKLLHFQNYKSFFWISVRARDYHKPEENH